MWFLSQNILLYTILTFPLEGSTLQLLFGKSELPAPLLLCFESIMKENKGDLNSSTEISHSLSDSLWTCYY